MKNEKQNIEENLRKIASNAKLMDDLQKKVSLLENNLNLFFENALKEIKKQENDR